MDDSLRPRTVSPLFLVRLSCLILLIVGFLLLATQGMLSFAQSSNCSGAALINQTLPSGGNWQMCWEERANEGIVLSDVYYTTVGGTTRKVLAEAALAQIHVPFHDNGARLHQLTETGLGGSALEDMDSADCAGTLLANNGKNVLCQQVEDRGYVYKYYASEKQGTALSLHSVSHVGEQTYVVTWRFYDEGIIEPAIGVSGQIPRVGTDAQYGWQLDNSGRVGIANVNDYYWRLHFDIGNNGANDQVEEIEIVNSGSVKNMTRQLLTTETGRPLDPSVKRSWRVLDSSITNADGHAVSYHIEPLHAGYDYTGTSSEPWTANDVYFTTHKACEKFISQNAAVGGCGDNVTTYLNGENINGAEIVVWYNLTYHQLPRSEDEAYRNIHWDSFQLVPRDWTAQSEIAQ